MKCNTFFPCRYSTVGNLNSCGSSSTNDEESLKFSSPNCTENTICYGCLSMYCRTCVRTQIDALKQVEVLLARLEAAETLFPSSQAFATQYPLSKSLEFTSRVKAMCLWYVGKSFSQNCFRYFFQVFNGSSFNIPIL